MLHEKQQHVSNRCMPAIVQTQSQAKLVFVTTLKMDNFDCTKMNTHFTACLWEGLFHEWKHKLLAPPYVSFMLVTDGSPPHTTKAQQELHCSVVLTVNLISS